MLTLLSTLLIILSVANVILSFVLIALMKYTTTLREENEAIKECTRDLLIRSFNNETIQ